MLRLAFLFIYLALCASYAQNDVGYFWHITDLHYDWTYFQNHVACNENVTDLGEYGNYVCDSPWTLINDSVVAMKDIKADADFIVWTGDSPPHIKGDRPTFDELIRVTKNITDLFMNVFPTTTVYVSLGNNDVYPHNQVPVDNLTRPLLEEMADMWEPWIKDAEQLRNFEKGGFFTLETPRGLRIVSLNSILYISGNKVTENESDPLDQFKWLEEVLSQAESKKEKVLIIGHVCPGILPPRNKLRTHARHNKRLVDIFKKYGETIISMLCGHAHQDIFKLLADNNGQPIIPMFLAPSVTPHRSTRKTGMGPAHNPGIRLFTYNRTTKALLDIEQYFINLPDSNMNHRTNWTKEYSMTEAYEIPDLSPESIYSAMEKLKKFDNGLIMEYFKRMRSSVNSNISEPCDDTCKHSIGCAFTNFELVTFGDCLQEYNTSGASHPAVAVVSLALIFINFVCLGQLIF